MFGRLIAVSRKRGLVWLIVLLLILAIAGATAYLVAGAGSNAVSDATLGFTVIAALGALAGAALILAGNAANVAQQRALAADVKRLAELSESSLDEARAQKPEPSVQFRLKDGLASEVRWPRQRDSRSIDIDTIIESETKRTLATLPTPKNTPQVTEIERLLGSATLAMIGAGPLTDQERRDFQARVDDYVSELKKWLNNYATWREQVGLVFSGNLQFDNRGRVPARDIHAYLDFPSEFVAVEEFPQLSSVPERPVFKRRTWQDMFSVPAFSGFYPAIGLGANSIVGRPNVRGPRYRKESRRVEYTIDKLIHGLPELSDDPVLFRIEKDGTYRVSWEIHAENLPEPTRGELTVHVDTEVRDHPPITALDQLLAELSARARTGSADPAGSV
jgi:hypothetical protein